MDWSRLWDAIIFGLGWATFLTGCCWVLYKLWPGLCKAARWWFMSNDPIKPSLEVQPLWLPNHGLYLSDWQDLLTEVYLCLGMYSGYLKADLYEPPLDFGADGNIYRLFVRVPAHGEVRLKYYRQYNGWALMQIMIDGTIRWTNMDAKPAPSFYSVLNNNWASRV